MEDRPPQPNDDPRSTRDQILDEARSLFADQGFEGTSLNDIAAAVGIKRPSLLHWFPSKDDIYRQVLSEAVLDWTQRVEAARRVELDGWDLVDQVLRVSFEFFRENPEIIRIVRREALTAHSPLGIDLGTTLRPYYNRAAAFFRREMDAGRFREQDAEQLILTGYGALLTYYSDHVMLRGLLGDDPFTDDRLEARYEHLTALFRGMLEP